MRRAGLFVFRSLLHAWPEARRIAIYTGRGNNGGDGYILASLLLEAERKVELRQLGNPQTLRGDARHAMDEFSALGGTILPLAAPLENVDLIVDALLGSGLNRPLDPSLASLITVLNDKKCPRLAIDIPSGLNADTCCLQPVAFQADITVSFVVRKRGLYREAGKRCVGRLEFSSLQVPSALTNTIDADCQLVDYEHDTRPYLQKRPVDSHKGSCGHILVVGGRPGYSGAVRLAAEAALRAGAGVATVATHPANVHDVVSGCPVLMSHGIKHASQLSPLVKRADAIVVGPGLGQNRWAQSLLDTVLQCGIPCVVDADALRILLPIPEMSASKMVVTPHIGEAAALLETDKSKIQSDCFQSATAISHKTNAVCILKGAGTIISNGTQNYICADGGPGLSVAGSGDILSGIIATYMAHHATSVKAAIFGVCIHAKAGDLATMDQPNGMIATDLFPFIRHCANRQT